MKKEFLKNQSEVLRSIRKNIKKSLREVSDLSGIELTRLSRIEAGQYILTVPEIKRLGYLYGEDLYETLSEQCTDDFFKKRIPYGVMSK
jgi:transcriptional regulator with XRE-family HTH domain